MQSTVPNIVPARGGNRPKITPRQPIGQRKTPQKDGCLPNAPGLKISGFFGLKGEGWLNICVWARYGGVLESNRGCNREEPHCTQTRRFPANDPIKNPSVNQLNTEGLRNGIRLVRPAFSHLS